MTLTKLTSTIDYLRLYEATAKVLPVELPEQYVGVSIKELETQFSDIVKQLNEDFLSKAVFTSMCTAAVKNAFRECPDYYSEDAIAAMVSIHLDTVVDTYFDAVLSKAPDQDTRFNLKHYVFALWSYKYFGNKEFA